MKIKCVLLIGNNTIYNNTCEQETTIEIIQEINITPRRKYKCKDLLYQEMFILEKML